MATEPPAHPAVQARNLTLLWAVTVAAVLIVMAVAITAIVLPTLARYDVRTSTSRTSACWAIRIDIDFRDVAFENGTLGYLQCGGSAARLTMLGRCNLRIVVSAGLSAIEPPTTPTVLTVEILRDGRALVSQNLDGNNRTGAHFVQFSC